MREKKALHDVIQNFALKILNSEIPEETLLEELEGIDFRFSDEAWLDESVTIELNPRESKSETEEAKEIKEEEPKPKREKDELVVEEGEKQKRKRKREADEAIKSDATIRSDEAVTSDATIRSDETITSDATISSNETIKSDEIIETDEIKQTDETKETVRCNLIHCATFANRVKLVLKLVEYAKGDDDSYVPLIDTKIKSTDSEDETSYESVTPLIIASEGSSKDLLRAILEQNPDLLGADTLNKECAVTLAANEEHCQIILDHAKKKEKLQQLLDKIFSDYDKFEEIVADKPTLAKCILKVVDKIPAGITLKDVIESLDEVRTKYLTIPGLRNERDAICQELRRLRDESPEYKPPEPVLCDKEQSCSLKQAYCELYDKEYFAKIFPNGSDAKPVITTKDEAVKYVLAQIYALFNSPKHYLKYLRFIDYEFNRYYKHLYKEDYSLKSKSFDFEVCDRWHFPIPHEDYQSDKKHSALQEFLYLLFSKEENLPQSVYKWVNLIPGDYANKAQAAGHFFMEARLGINLFHGKLSHMLQQAIILYAIKNKEICTHFETDNGNIDITLLDILKGHFEGGTYDFEDNIKPFWEFIRDSYADNANINDPNFLHSMIMFQGKDKGFEFPRLADYLTDSFCKGYLRLVKFYREQGITDLSTPAKLMEKMRDIPLTELIPDPLMVEAVKKKEAGKSELILAGNDHAVFKFPDDKYKNAKEFKLEDFRDLQEEVKIPSSLPVLNDTFSP